MPRMSATPRERQCFSSDRRDLLGGALVRLDVMVTPHRVEARHQLA